MNWTRRDCRPADSRFNPLNAKLNPICHLLALLAHPILHVGRIRVKSKSSTIATLYTWPPDDGLQMSPKHVEAW
jgi:hypothetical protein